MSAIELPLPLRKRVGVRGMRIESPNILNPEHPPRSFEKMGEMGGFLPEPNFSKLF
jgi:hypothetical protein